MDDRIEHSGDTAATTSNGMGRREMLQRTGFVVGAAALWNTPIIKTIGASAAVATGFEVEACVDANGKLLGAPSSLEFRLDPYECDSILNDPVPGGPWPITAENTTEFFEPCCDLSTAVGPFKVEWWFGGNLKTFPSGEPAGSEENVPALGSFTVFKAPAGGVANLFFKITPTSPTDCVQRFGFHYSCSEPLIIGDQHGSVVIIGYEA